MKKILIIMILLVSGAAYAGDPTEELAKQLFAEEPKATKHYDLRPSVRAYNGMPCGYKPHRIMPRGCALLCIDGEWQEVCQ